MSKLLDNIVTNIHESCYTFGVPSRIPRTPLVTGNSYVFYKRLVNSDWFLTNLALTHLGTIFRITPLTTFKYEDGTVRVADEYQLSPDPITPLDVVKIPQYVHGYLNAPNTELRIIPLMLQYFFGRAFKNKVLEDFVVNNANAVSFGEMMGMTIVIDNSPGVYFNAGCY